MHQHHHCSCDHTIIKLCKTCKVPYCTACGYEWAEKCHLTHYWNWGYHTTPFYTASTSGPTLTGTNFLQDKVGATTANTASATITYATSSEHKHN